jgi:hypothetical protein
MCPGGEEAVLKTVGQRCFAGSNPVHSVGDETFRLRRQSLGGVSDSPLGK